MFKPILGAVENGPILPHDINEVYWGSLAFFIIASLLWWKAVPAGKEAMIKRRERIAAELDEAAAAKAQAEATLATVSSQLSGTDGERVAMLEEAKRTAQALSQETDTRAEQEAVEARERALRDIASSRDQAFVDLQSLVSDLTLGATELVVRQNLDDSTQTDLVEKYIAQLSSN